MAHRKNRLRARDVVNESQVQSAVKRLYRSMGCKIYDTSQRRRADITPGIPDLIVFHPGKGLQWFHEVKVEGGRQSPAQKRFERDCIAAKSDYILGGVAAAKDHLWVVGVVARVA